MSVGFLRYDVSNMPFNEAVFFHASACVSIKLSQINHCYLSPTQKTKLCLFTVFFFFLILLLLSKGVCHVALQMLCDYWMRLIMIPWIIKLRSKVSVKPEGEANDTDTRLDNSWYHTKTELNNCSIAHFKTICKKRHFSLVF